MDNLRQLLERLNLEDKENCLEVCTTALERGDSDIKLQAIQILGKTKQKKAFDLLIENLYNDNLYVVCDSIIALANLQDSRALFPLINFYNTVKSPEIKKRVLYYIELTGDSRAEEFLEEQRQHSENDYLLNSINQADQLLKNGNFKYRYVGEEPITEEYLKTKPKPIQLTSQEDLDSIIKILEDDKTFSFTKPQTYIVDLNKDFYIGGYLNEHVEVAQGNDVLAAGEVKFEKTPEGWAVKCINQRSNGYFPHKNCFASVKKSLGKTDIIFNKKEFDEVYPKNGYNDADWLSVQIFGEHYKGKFKKKNRSIEL